MLQGHQLNEKNFAPLLIRMMVTVPLVLNLPRFLPPLILLLLLTQRQRMMTTHIVTQKKEQKGNLTLVLAHKKNPCPERTKDILHDWHPRAVVEGSEYAQTGCTRDTFNAIIRVAQMLEEREGKSTEE